MLWALIVNDFVVSQKTNPKFIRFMDFINFP